jgi:hypothetical protein
VLILNDEEELFEDLDRYHHLVGKYLTITRPDISYALVLLVNSWRPLGFDIGKLLLILFDI